MSRITIINGHPHYDRDHFVHALAAAYADAADAGHQIRLLEVAKLDFPVLRDPEDWKSGETPEGLLDAQEDIRWADHLVILFPLWLGGMPALTRAFLEQVCRPGFAVEPQGTGLYRKLLKGKSARIIVTMGMPATVYSLYFRGHSVKSLKRNVLQFVGISPVRISLVGGVEMSAAHRKKWLRRIESLGRRGI